MYLKKMVVVEFKVIVFKYVCKHGDKNGLGWRGVGVVYVVGFVV